MRNLGNGNIRRFGAGVAYGTGANIKQLQSWDFATTDDAATVETAHFFDPLVAEMNVGDVIQARLDLDGTPLLRNYLVSANDGTHVTVTLAVATAAA